MNMELRKIGKSDLNVSPICLGTMTFGQQNTESEGHQQLDFATERGINFIDTAEMYPVPPREKTVNRTETIVGNWLKNKDRSRVILATKVAGPGRSMDWIRGGPKALDEENIRAAIEGSLQRLQTDYIDIYQLHWPDRNVPMFGQYRFDPDNERSTIPIEKQLEILGKLVDEGKVRYIGISNETPWGVMEFLRLARQHDLPEIISVQNSYNLINRGYEFGLAEISFREKIGLLAYSPLAFGLLSGKYLDNPDSSGRVTEFAGFARRYEKPNVQPAIKAYADLAHKYDMSPATLALSFVYRQKFAVSTIIGATSLMQLEENIEAWNHPLSEEIIEEVENIHLIYMNPAP